MTNIEINMNNTLDNDFDLSILSTPGIKDNREINIKFGNDIIQKEYLKLITINLLYYQNFKLIKETSSSLNFKNNNFKKIAFHIYFFCIRGTSTAIYDYADYNETILGNESIIVVPKSGLSKNGENSSRPSRPPPPRCNACDSNLATFACLPAGRRFQSPICPQPRIF